MIFIRAKHIQKLYGLGRTAAYEKMKELKNAFGKEKHQRITVQELAEYEMTDEDYIRRHIL